MKVQEIMSTSPKCCIPSDTATKAARIMKDMDTSIVPIIENEQNRRLVGVVTDRDLCLKVIAEGQDPQNVQVRVCMMPALVCCTPNDDLEKVLDLMRDNQVRRIPVVDDDGVIQGMMSMADVVQCAEMPTNRTHETLKKVSEPTLQASKPRAKMARKST
jgi:CBS domain-containing protein